MITVLNIPTKWKMIVDMVRECTRDHKAVLAGGALRDYDHGRQVKDLDIFINTRNEEQWKEVLFNLVWSFGLPKEPKTVDNDSSYSANPEILKTASFEYEGVTINLIGLDLPHFNLVSVLSRIDFGICRIGYNGDHLYKSYEYVDDSIDKTFTLHRSTGYESFEASKRRYFELTKEKYKGWQFAIGFSPNVILGTNPVVKDYNTIHDPQPEHWEEGP